MSLALKILIIKLHTFLRVSSKQFNEIEKVKEINSIILSGKHYNLEALNGFAFKLFVFNNDTSINTNLEYFHLFDFPEDQEDENLEFCQEFGGFSVPLLKQNESLAYQKYKIKQQRRRKSLFSFYGLDELQERWICIKKQKKIKKIQNIYQQNQLILITIYNYHRFINIPELELRQRFDEMYSKVDIQQCDQQILIGSQIGETNSNIAILLYLKLKQLMKIIQLQNNKQLIEINKYNYNMHILILCWK